MLRLHSLLVFSVILLVSVHSCDLQGQATKAQPNGKGPAFTEPPQDDPTFPLMGEFVGTVKSSEGKPDRLGLQVRAIGNDQFDAIAYFGGLPGQKQHRPEPVRMIGMRSGDFVVLSGGPWAVIVENDFCRLVDRQGNPAGQLKRIKRRSRTLHAPPPEGATVLFSGTDTEQFVNAEMTADGLLKEGADVKPMFQDFNLHVEFRLPYMPQADDQQRGNSGLYLQNRYECQVLDSFAQTPKINGCGALYRFKAPDLNMCLPPLVWQTYDVQFTAPRWNADGTKNRDARITSWINGVKVQDDVALKNKTGAGKPEGAFLSPMKFQNHGDPVRFRNIWIVDRGLSVGEFPVVPSKAQIQAAIRSEQQKRKQRAQEARKRAADARQAAADQAKAAAEALKAKSELERAQAEFEKAMAKQAGIKKLLSEIGNSSNEGNDGKPGMNQDNKEQDNKEQDNKEQDNKEQDSKEQDVPQGSTPDLESPDQDS